MFFNLDLFDYCSRFWIEVEQFFLYLTSLLHGYKSLDGSSHGSFDSSVGNTSSWFSRWWCTYSTSLADVSRSQECRTVLEEELREMVRGKNDDLKHDLDQLSISRDT